MQRSDVLTSTQIMKLFCKCGCGCLQSLVDAWAECMDSLYGFLLIRGCVAVATSSWWQLDPEEKKLLALLVSVKGTCKTCDIPVFLPCKSPAVSMLCFLTMVA